MLKSIMLNLEAIEALHFFWIAASEKDHVDEKFFHDLSEMNAVKLMYDEEFNQESVRRALSAIKNREPFSGNKKERKFWNLNMWAMEDLELTASMITPIKQLNLEHLMPLLNEYNNKNYEMLEVYFSPLQEEVYQIIDNKLLVNFFRIRTSFVDDSVTIEDLPVETYIEEKLKEIIK
ncbi:MAG: hypothetical protein JXR88_05190 [Clostridia bacterium]|nr:hypothetical protein [Clostridia bacterium]